MRSVTAKRQGARSGVVRAAVLGIALMMGVLWYLGDPGQVHACLCVGPGTLSGELEKSSAVFAGKVISRHPYNLKAALASPVDHTTVGFEVSAVWKGTVHEEMYITTAPSAGACGFFFHEGEEYIVFAHRSAYAEGGYNVGICSLTGLLSRAQEYTDALGKGDAPQAGIGGPAPKELLDTVRDGPEVHLTFDFESGAQGWKVGFADLPVKFDQSIYELKHGRGPLPDGLGGSGIYVQGHNRSDDLFMFLKKRVGGLRPNTSYVVSVSIDLATNVPAGLVGIGGAPGESVFVKAGASTIEPTVEEGDNQHLRMNIDKGNQSRGGESMVVLGNVAHPEIRGSEYRIKTLDNSDAPLMVETDSEGQVWLIAGTDSGFEGLTALYYSRINYTLDIVEPPATGGYVPPVWAVALAVGAGAILAAGGLGLMVLPTALRRLPPKR